MEHPEYNDAVYAEVVDTVYHKKKRVCCCCRRRKLELTRLIDKINKNTESILTRVNDNPGRFHEDTITRLISKRDDELKMYQEEMDIIDDCDND